MNLIDLRRLRNQIVINLLDLRDILLDIEELEQIYNRLVRAKSDHRAEVVAR